MKLGIIGGRLQGIEAAYLARKAGMRSLVIDRNAHAPAFGICDEAIVMDAMTQRREVAKVLATCDAILPANENHQLLSSLPALCAEVNVPLLFDLQAYETTASKAKTNAFLGSINVPMPRPFNQCGLPVVVKPSEASGSKGVSRVDRMDQMEDAMSRAGYPDSDIIIQEYVEGPSLSIEVLGAGEEAYPLVVTDILVDERHDCKMVLSPSSAPKWAHQEMASIASACSQGLNLHGLMDVESILTKDGNRILELDARIPSQTPSAVLHSHGINILTEMVRLARNGTLGRLKHPDVRCSAYGHIIFENGRLRTIGEGGLRADRPMHLISGAFGADDIITDAQSWTSDFACTYMVSATSPRGLRTKLEGVYAGIEDACGQKLNDPGLETP